MTRFVFELAFQFSVSPNVPLKSWPILTNVQNRQVRMEAHLPLLPHTESIADLDTYSSLGPDQKKDTVLEEEISPFRSWAVLMNILIGIGLLSIPYCFKTGIFTNALLLIALAGIAFLSFMFLVDASTTAQVGVDYKQLMDVAFQHRFVWLPNVICLIIYFGGATLHVQFTYDLITQTIQEASPKPVPEWTMNRWLWILGLAVLVELPLTFIRTIAKYSRISTATCFLIVWYLVHSAYYLIERIVDHNFDPDHQIKYFTVNEFFIGALGIEAFAYQCHATVGPSLARLINPTRSRKYGVLAALVISGAVCYLTAGLLPYLTLVDGITDPIIFICYPKNQVFTMITKCIYGVFLIVTAPLLLYTGRLVGVRAFTEAALPQWKMDLYGVLLLSVSALTAAGVKSISVMFDFIGGVADSLIMYIFPAIFYIRICPKESLWKYCIAWVLIPLGTAVIGVSLYHSITSLTKSGS
jgi:hypothetical protein